MSQELVASFGSGCLSTFLAIIAVVVAMVGVFMLCAGAGQLAAGRLRRDRLDDPFAGPAFMPRSRHR